MLWTGTTSWTPLRALQLQQNTGSSCHKPAHTADFCHERLTDFRLSSALRCSKRLQAGANIPTIPGDVCLSDLTMSAWCIQMPTPCSVRSMASERTDEDSEWGSTVRDVKAVVN
eukprot:s571_g32.t1